MSRDFFDPSEPAAGSAHPVDLREGELYTQPLEHERAIRLSADQEKLDRRLLRKHNVYPPDSGGD